jgi:hypothetical protein
VTPLDSTSGWLILLDESPARRETSEVVETGPSLNPIPTPPPVMPILLPYPICHSVQCTMCGQGIKSHPYELDFFQPRPLRVSAKDNHSRRGSVCNSGKVSDGNSLFTDESKSILGSQQSIVSHQDDLVLNGANLHCSRSHQDSSACLTSS